MSVLKPVPDEAGVYEFTDVGFAYGVWIKIKNLEVCVQATDEGAAVDIWSAATLKEESGAGPLTSTYAYFAEGEDS